MAASNFSNGGDEVSHSSLEQGEQREREQHLTSEISRLEGGFFTACWDMFLRITVVYTAYLKCHFSPFVDISLCASEWVID